LSEFDRMETSGAGFAGRSLLAGDPAFAKIDHRLPAGFFLL
jgi:hypothetical protein